MVALAIRLVVIGLDAGYEPRHDAYDYDRHARSIAAGDGFPESIYVPDGGPTAVRAPAYPFALGFVYAIPGPDLTAGRVLGALLGALAVLILFALVSRIWGRRIGLLAAAIAAIYPPLIHLSTELYSENLFIVLLLAAAYCVLRCRERASLGWAAVAGLVFGAAALTRGPGVIALIPLLIGLWFIKPRLSWPSLRIPLVALTCVLVAVAPWSARNLAAFGAFVPITTSSGYGLTGTYNDESLAGRGGPAGWRNPVNVAAYRPYFERAGIDEADLDADLRERAGEFILAHPFYVIEVAAHNLLRLAYLEGGSVVSVDEEVTDRGIGTARRPLDLVGFGLAVVLAAFGVVAIRRSRGRRQRDREDPDRIGKEMLPTGPIYLWLIPLSLVLIAAPVAGLPRYRVPADPFLLILAAIGLSAAWDRYGRRSAPSKFRKRRGSLARWPTRSNPRTMRVTVVALLAAGAVAGVGCGGGDEVDGSGGRQPASEPARTVDPARAAERRAYIRRGDRICARANDRIGAIFDNLTARSGGPLALTTEGLVRPGIPVRAHQAAALRALDRPPGENANLDKFLGLFATIDAVSRRRLRVGEGGDLDEALRLELLARDLAAEQQRAARAYGFKDCAADVLAEAFN